MIKKTFIIFILFLSFSFLAKAQTDFVLSLTMPQGSDLVFYAHELPDGSFLFAGKSYISNTQKSKPLLIKSDPYGNILFLKQFDLPSGKGDFYNILVNDENLYIIGSSTDSIAGNSKVFFSELTEDLDTLGIHYYNLPDSLSIGNGKCFRNSTGDFIYYGFLMPNHEPYIPYYMYVLKWNPDKDKNFTTFKIIDSIAQCQTIIEKKNHDGYYAFVNKVALMKSMMLEMDTSFTIQSAFSFTGNYRNMLSAQWVNDTNIIFAAEKASLPPPYTTEDRGIGVMLLNPEDIIISQAYIGNADTVDFPAFRESIIVRNPETIYVGGTKNVDQTIWSTFKSWYILSKLDGQLNVVWTKYYGGDAYYNLWTIKETQDSGCLMLGTRYDYLTQNYERDISIIKVDGNGIITSTNEMPPLTVSEAIVYPNPGSTQLTIETALKGLQFELYSNNGQTVVSQPVNNGTITVNTSALPAGVYFYRFMNKDKIVESGKWMKE